MNIALFCIGCLSINNHSYHVIYWSDGLAEEPNAFRGDQMVAIGDLVAVALRHPGRKFYNGDHQELGVRAVTIYQGTALCALHARQALYYYQATHPRPATVPIKPYQEW